jgi:hypothetical protein
MSCTLLGIYGRLEGNCCFYFFRNVGRIRWLYISKSRREELTISHFRQIWWTLKQYIWQFWWSNKGANVQSTCFKNKSITAFSAVHAKTRADTTCEVSDIWILQNKKCRNNVTMRRVWIFASLLLLRWSYHLIHVGDILVDVHSLCIHYRILSLEIGHAVIFFVQTWMHVYVDIVFNFSVRKPQNFTTMNFLHYLIYNQYFIQNYGCTHHLYT